MRHRTLAALLAMTSLVAIGPAAEAQARRGGGDGDGSAAASADANGTGTQINEMLEKYGPADIPPHTDYANDAYWVCRPGRDDTCAKGQDATLIAADGTRTKELFKPDPNAPIDCFYIYPSVSGGPGFNAPLDATTGPRHAASTQFARMATKCRPLAPMYRQLTGAAMRAGVPDYYQIAIQDVRDAFKYYLAHDNHGRGFVILGHSQGAGMAIELVRQEVDGKPIQKQLVSVMLGGQNLPVPAGKKVGGDFKHIPLCASKSEIGCVVIWATYRADPPPPPESKMTRNRSPDLRAACVNTGSPGATGPVRLDSYIPTAKGRGKPELIPSQPVDTPYFAVKGLISGQCVSDGKNSYFAVTVDPGEAKARGLEGSLLEPAAKQTWFGLHTMDFSISMGSLLDLLDAQTKTWASKKR